MLQHNRNNHLQKVKAWVETKEGNDCDLKKCDSFEGRSKKDPQAWYAQAPYSKACKQGQRRVHFEKTNSPTCSTSSRYTTSQGFNFCPSYLFRWLWPEKRGYDANIWKKRPGQLVFHKGTMKKHHSYNHFSGIYNSVRDRYVLRDSFCNLIVTQLSGCHRRSQNSPINIHKLSMMRHHQYQHLGLPVRPKVEDLKFFAFGMIVTP